MPDSSLSKESPSLTPQQRHYTASQQGALTLYRELVVGDRSWGSLLWYEMIMLVSSQLSGLLGLGARTLLYPNLFGSCGKRPAIGRGVTIRHPAQMRLGDRVVIEDYAALDVRGTDSALHIGDAVIVGRYSTLAAKGGVLTLGNGVNIGSYCRIATQSRLHIGKSTLVAAYAYVGPGNHQPASGDIPLIEQDMEDRGGVSIGSHVWIGARATILDGVTIGDGAIVGAHSLVREDVPPHTVVAGTPARVIRRVEGDG